MIYLLRSVIFQFATSNYQKVIHTRRMGGWIPKITICGSLGMPMTCPVLAQCAQLNQPWDTAWLFSAWAIQNTLVVWLISGFILPSSLGIMIAHSRETYQPTSFIRWDRGIVHGSLDLSSFPPRPNLPGPYFMFHRLPVLRTKLDTRRQTQTCLM